MAVASNRLITIEFLGDVNAPNLAYAAAENVSSPGTVESKELSSGFNTLTVPDGATALTIIPPSGNAIGLTLKGITGDTGIGIHLTDPTSIALAAAQATVGLTTTGIVTVRLIWS